MRSNHWVTGVSASVSAAVARNALTTKRNGRFSSTPREASLAGMQAASTRCYPRRWKQKRVTTSTASAVWPRLANAAPIQ